MESTKKFIFFIFAVIITWAFWTFGFSFAFHKLTLFIGSPKSQFQFWSLLLVLSFAMGFLPSFFLFELTGLNKIIFVFVFTFLIGLLTFATTFVFGGYSALADVLSSKGFWAFLLGALLGAFIKFNTHNKSFHSTV